MIKQRKIAITGAAGFIGSNLAMQLVKDGVDPHDIDMFDDLSNGHLQLLGKLGDSLYPTKFVDPWFLSRVRSGVYGTVYHLAAVPRVSYSVEHPMETWRNNVSDTVELLDAIRLSPGRTRFVFSSSSSVYGGADQLPTPVTAPKLPKSPYALQKSVIEDVIDQYVMHYEIDAVSLRYFNVFGPNQLGSSAYATAVSSWLEAIKSGKRCRRDGDGSQSRDMCYVDNVVQANILAGSRERRWSGQRLNVATGVSVTNNEILSYLAERYKFEIADAPVRAGDVPHTLADISETVNELGYRPKVMFWEGLERTISWYMSSPLTTLHSAMLEHVSSIMVNSECRRCHIASYDENKVSTRDDAWLIVNSIHKRPDSEFYDQQGEFDRPSIVVLGTTLLVVNELISNSCTLDATPVEIDVDVMGGISVWFYESAMLSDWPANEYKHTYLQIMNRNHGRLTMMRVMGGAIKHFKHDETVELLRLERIKDTIAGEEET